MSPRTSLLRRLIRPFARLIPSGSLTERTVKSGVWASLLNVSERGLQLLAVIVLARVLSPAEFGVMMIALLVLAGFEQLSQVGIDQALIYNESDDVDDYLDTAFTIKLVRGVVIAAVLFVGGNPVANFLGEPSAGPLIQAIGIASLIFGLQNPAVVYMQKNLEYHRQFAYKGTGTFVNAAVSIAVGVVFLSPWALVVGRIADNATRVVVSYLLCEHRPRLRFDLAYGREMIGYGKWIFGSTGLAYLLYNADDAFVTWLLSASALAFYQFAYRLSTMPPSQVSSVVSMVMFPAFSRLQNDVPALRDAYLRTVQVATLVSFPMAAGVVLVSEPFVRTVLGEEWLPMVILMQILAAWGLLNSLGYTIGALLNAVGRPDVLTKLLVAKLAVMAVAIYPVTDTYGVAGTATLVVFVALLDIPVGLWLVARSLQTSVVTLVRPTVFPSLGSVVMVGAVLAVQTSLPAAGVVSLVVPVVVGVASYAFALLVFEHVFDLGLRSMLRTFRQSFAA